MNEQPSGRQALDRLLQGNRRYVSGEPQRPNQTAARRREVALEQQPNAIILSCSDSRVPPELIFDQGIGDLFVVRTAGNVVDDVALGSIEYAVLHFHSPLLLVLGHQRCGAVTAAVQGGEHPGHIGTLIALIEPAVRATEHEPGSHVNNAVAANVRGVVHLLASKSEVMHQTQTSGALMIAAAVYSLDTGKVQILD